MTPEASGTPYPIHAVTSMFPIMGGEELKALADDIKTHGQHESVLVWSGQIIDGRNRLAACRLAGVDPSIIHCDGEFASEEEVIAFIIGANIHRRHLTASQLATLGAELLPVLKEEAKVRQRLSGGAVPPRLGEPVSGDVSQRAAGERMLQGKADTSQKTGKGGEAVTKAAEIVGSSREYVRDAAKLKAEAPEQFAAVKAGTKTIPEAKREVKASAEPKTREEKVVAAAVSFIDARKAEAKRMREIAKEFHNLGRQLLDIANTPIGAFLHRQSIQSAVAQIKSTVKHASPFAVCPYCGGKKCKSCQQSGWVPQVTFEQAPRELREVNASGGLTV